MTHIFLTYFVMAASSDITQITIVSDSSIATYYYGV